MNRQEGTLNTKLYFVISTFIILIALFVPSTVNFLSNILFQVTSFFSNLIIHLGNSTKFILGSSHTRIIKVDNLQIGVMGFPWLILIGILGFFLKSILKKKSYINGLTLFINSHLFSFTEVAFLLYGNLKNLSQKDLLRIFIVNLNTLSLGTYTLYFLIHGNIFGSSYLSISLLTTLFCYLLTSNRNIMRLIPELDLSRMKTTPENFNSYLLSLLGHFIIIIIISIVFGTLGDLLSFNKIAPALAKPISSVLHSLIKSEFSTFYIYRESLMTLSQSDRSWIFYLNSNFINLYSFGFLFGLLISVFNQRLKTALKYSSIAFLIAVGVRVLSLIVIFFTKF